ncbi:hypothetical protein ACFL4G_08525 [Thermodesulfobacteriota bacterium]
MGQSMFSDREESLQPEQINRAVPLRRIFHVPAAGGGALETKSDWPWYIAGILCAFMLYLPVLLDFDRISLDDDWLHLYQFYGIARESILDFGEFPVRTFYLGGGFPVICHPEFPAGTPMLIPVLLFGEVGGLKIGHLFPFVIAFLGTFWYVRRILNLSQISAFFAGLTLCFSGVYPLSFSSGGYNLRYYYYFPFLLGFATLSCRNRRWIAPASIILALMLTDGALSAVSIAFFLGIYMVLSSIGISGRKIRVSWRGLVIYPVIVALAVGLGMFRVLPAVNFLRHDSRSIDAYSPETIENSEMSMDHLISSLAGDDISYGAWHLGGLTCVLAIIGVLIYGMRWKRHLIAGAIALWLCAATQVRPDLFYLLWRLPVFHSMEEPSTYFRFFIGFVLILFAAGTLQPLSRVRKRIPATIAAVSVIVFSVGPSFLKSADFLGGIFAHDLSVTGKTKEFCHVSDPYLDLRLAYDIPMYSGRPFYEVWLGDDLVLNRYEWFLKGFGVIEWSSDFENKRSVIPKYGLRWDPDEWELEQNPDYRGEVFFSSPENKARLDEMTGNTITVTCDLKVADQLIINQNFDPAWHSDAGPVVDVNGLVGVELDEPGTYRIHLNYRLQDFSIGLGVSLFSLLLLGWIGIRRPGDVPDAGIQL